MVLQSSPGHRTILVLLMEKFDLQHLNINVIFLCQRLKLFRNFVNCWYLCLVSTIAVTQEICTLLVALSLSCVIVCSCLICIPSLNTWTQRSIWQNSYTSNRKLLSTFQGDKKLWLINIELNCLLLNASWGSVPSLDLSFASKSELLVYFCVPVLQYLTVICCYLIIIQCLHVIIRLGQYNHSSYVFSFKIIEFKLFFYIKSLKNEKKVRLVVQQYN